ncbi:MAG: MFS transporter, partial [Burkholderiales bacterium]
MTSPAVASAAPAPADNGATRAAVVLLAIAGFFSGAALRICDGLLPRLAADFSVTPGVAGRVVLTFAIAYGISQLLFGPLGDRYGKARVMCASLFACAASSSLWSFSTSEFDKAPESFTRSPRRRSELAVTSCASACNLAARLE